MCGINGIVSLRREEGDYRAQVERMNAALAHRGPDDAGVYVDERAALGHRRLAVIDLSAAGQQPMASADGRYQVVFNGEIYNFRELRAQLDYPFRTHTDTEVLLAAWQAWGVGSIARLVGMFAFAMWDRVNGELFLVRDRLGVKPLYYHLDDRRLIFSSELRGVLASGLVPAAVDPDALVDYLRYQCVQQPDTMVQGVRLLAPGHYLRCLGRSVAARCYWSPLRRAAADESGTEIDAETARRRVFSALRTAVERRLVADVPFGAFLSGGIDSSAIVALMSGMTDQVSTFTITFAEEEYSEARYARRVAEKFRTDHHEIRLDPEDFLALLPEALDRMDHPSADGPNTYVVSRVTKGAGITMALSGLGGDELFAGYPVFVQALRLQKMRWLERVPPSLRRRAGGWLRAVRPGVASAKIAAVLARRRLDPLSVYAVYRQVFLDDQILELLPGRGLPHNSVDRLLNAMRAEAGFDDLPLLSRISLAEMATYLQHVLLRDTDQMSMAHALEVREPFLDHELVELVLGLPDRLKYPVTPKRLLVESLGDLLPAEIVHRPKMGFTLPYDRWMRTSLHAFCEERLRRLAEREAFSGPAVLRCWRDFQAGNPAVTWSRVWMLVVLEHWLEKNGVD